MMRDPEGPCPSWDFGAVPLSLSSVPPFPPVETPPAARFGMGKNSPSAPNHVSEGTRHLRYAVVFH